MQAGGPGGWLQRQHPTRFALPRAETAAFPSNAAAVEVAALVIGARARVGEAEEGEDHASQ